MPSVLQALGSGYTAKKVLA